MTEGRRQRRQKQQRDARRVDARRRETRLLEGRMVPTRWTLSLGLAVQAAIRAWLSLTILFSSERERYEVLVGLDIWEPDADGDELFGIERDPPARRFNISKDR